jgi:hypothetical protein
MFKLGIFTSEDYAPERRGPLGRFRWALNRHRISLKLLRTGVPASATEVRIFEAIMRDLRLNSGIFRTTFNNRFQNLDPVINDLLLEHFSPEAAIAVHDWAASDCLTSAEWAESLFRAFPNATLQASDLSLFIVEVTLPTGDALIVERNGEPLQYVSPWFVFNWNNPEQRPKALTRIMASKAETQLALMRSQIEIPESWLDSPSDAITVDRCMLRKLPMTHPRAEAFRSCDARFSIRSHSAFEKLPAPVEIIRSMNIYNPGYFPAARLSEGARTVWSSLKPGGIWIVGRTWRENPPASNVSFLQRTETGFTCLHRHGDGSEIETLAVRSGYM